MLSVIIITKNEAHNLMRCLSSVRWAKEIIVVDADSTDNTVAIAKQFTPQVFVYADWQGYGRQKQRALALATQPWVLNLDADEVVDKPLKAAIEKAIFANEACAYRIPIVMNFYGKPVPHSSSPKKHIRLFKRQGAVYSDDIVHEKIILAKNACIKKIARPIMHYSFQDLSHALAKLNRYSSSSALVRKQSKKPPAFLLIFLNSLWMFFRCYLLQRGFLDGQAGFLLAQLNAQGTFFRGMKQLYPDAQKPGDNDHD